jgi:hypothetical protein
VGRELLSLVGARLGVAVRVDPARQRPERPLHLGGGRVLGQAERGQRPAAQRGERGLRRRGRVEVASIGKRLHALALRHRRLAVPLCPARPPAGLVAGPRAAVQELSGRERSRLALRPLRRDVERDVGVVQRVERVEPLADLVARHRKQLGRRALHPGPHRLDRDHEPAAQVDPVHLPGRHAAHLSQGQHPRDAPSVERPQEITERRGSKATGKVHGGDFSPTRAALSGPNSGGPPAPRKPR